MESLILGFCECDNCGKEYFVWNTFFRCKKCGSRKFHNTSLPKEMRWDDDRETAVVFNDIFLDGGLGDIKKAGTELAGHLADNSSGCDSVCT